MCRTSGTLVLFTDTYKIDDGKIIWVAERSIWLRWDMPLMVTVNAPIKFAVDGRHIFSHGRTRQRTQAALAAQGRKASEPIKRLELESYGESLAIDRNGRMLSVPVRAVTLPGTNRKNTSVKEMHPIARKILPLFLTSLISVVIGCGGSPAPVPPATQQSKAVRSGTVFVGDSILGSWNLDAYFTARGYINGGWFGKRTDEILAVFPSILDGSRVCHGFDGVPSDPRFPFECRSITPPAQVVILLGWNDMLQAKDTTQAAANIKTMAQMAQAAHVNVVLVVPYRWDSEYPDLSWMVPWDSCSDLFPFRANQEPVLNASIRQTGIELGINVADLEPLFVCQSDYTVDGLHPNASGFKQMHDAIARALRTQG